MGGFESGDSVLGARVQGFKDTGLILGFGVQRSGVRGFVFRVSVFGFSGFGVPPKNRRGAIAQVNFSDFRGNTRQKWIDSP